MKTPVERNDFCIAKTTCPCFLMNAPFSLATDVWNNQHMVDLMAELKPEERTINLERAISQFQELYRFIAQRALVYLLPSHPGLQDQTYVANLGIVLPHQAEPTVVIANYYSEVRRQESIWGRDFFKLMEFPHVIDAPTYFEGEADLKHIRNNIYCGAYGLRTSKAALDWFSQSLDMKIIPIFMQDPYLYHLDCLLFPISPESILICTEKIDKAALKELEHHVEIYDIAYQNALVSSTNALALGSHILVGSDSRALGNPGNKWHESEKRKIKFLEQLCRQINRELVLFDLYEFDKSGASLSCMVMHLNRNNYKIPPERKNWIIRPETID
jgi:N-dimethylarginine dimethylaminohydrolase